MMLTEKEARKKWCPFARTIDGYPGDGANVQGYAASANRGMPDKTMASLNCAASDCMAWRWAGKNTRETTKMRHPVEYDAVAGSVRVVDGEPWRYEYTDIDSEGEFDLLHRWLSDEDQEKQGCRGYCGLAGDTA